MDATRTHCPYCALQCGMELRRSDSPTAASPLEVAGWDAFPVNAGALCGKGAAAAELLAPALRLNVPMIRDRKGGVLREASWDEALDVTAAALVAAQDRYGRDAVGIFGGGGLTHEKAYSLGKFARVAVRTPHIDYNGRFCMSAAAAAGNRAFGIDRGLPFPLADVARTRLVGY